MWLITYYLGLAFGLYLGYREPVNIIAWRPLPEPYRPERQKEGAQQNES